MLLKKPWRIPKIIAILTFYIARKYFHLTRYFFDLLLSKFFYTEKSNILFDSTQKNENLCIFSHYDPHNLIDPYVVHYLNELNKCQCDIIFVTTCETLSSNEVDKIKYLCKRIIIKSNRGIDFAAHKCALASEKNLNEYQKVILVNDSVYGPFHSLKDIINYGENHGLDMWGATDSYMIKYHIQSYFIVFAKSIFMSREFSQFWKNVHSLGLKNNAIIRYEIGMSQFFIRHGFKLSSYCTSAIKDSRVKHDPTHHTWDNIILTQNYPFIKRMLIRENPHEVEIAHWQEVLKKHYSYNINLITNHLERTAT